jgi:hypothetical protein
MQMEAGTTWEHLQSVHLKPLNLSREQLLAQARAIAQPLAVKPAVITYIDLRDRVIYFSVENAELLIAFAAEHAGIPWQDVVEWQISHEKGHLTCRSLYLLPSLYKPYILVSVEDYFINRYLLPEKTWPVCLANARCATAIRNLNPLPDRLRDGYYYCTLATFLAYDAISFKDINFLKVHEARLVEQIAKCFRKIREPRKLPLIMKKIGEVFENPPILQDLARSN